MQLELLQAISVCEEAQQLASSTPLLFLLLVDAAQQAGLSAKEFAQAVLMPRREQLHLCGLPGSQALSKLMARMQFTVHSSNHLRCIKAVLQQHDHVQRLARTQPIHGNHLLLLYHYQGAFWPNLMQLVSEGDSQGKVISINHLVHSALRLGASSQQLRSISTYNGLVALHNHCIDQVNLASHSSQACRARAWQPWHCTACQLARTACRGHYHEALRGLFY